MAADRGFRVISREPVGARRLGFTGGAVVAHALVVWVATRSPPPPPRPAVPLDVLLVPPGALRERLLLPSPAPAPERRAPGPLSPAPGPARRPDPRRLVPPNVPVSASAPPLEAVDPGELPALTGGEVAFSGKGGDPYSRLPRGGGGAGGGIAPGGVEASEWLVLHQREIVRRIQERASTRPYPIVAAAMGWTGLVRVAFTIRTDGSVADLRVVKSSGRQVLDECALEDVRASAPFPRPSEEQSVEVPILYVLT
ncbi:MULTISPECIES: energy transducer TonB [Anaeromyxobacter]|uniref:energy transducer TonB n=1 Tax=Anaeromyxobacter TaxID=161492 RepID=UPI001F5A80D9|nr:MULTISPECIES: energy transducer TonB [unclassified Anaeromyxobacter]